ncbi:SDR family NAD(P)-dependent oxidoreductase [Leptospira koniambonensis]|uniref:SDR family NAD(P)-dependent oxidoreductase n=1 Tax=Leptospira koniambonensis TaxID=2484950 RepID=A0A4R9J2G1_9LEPT|nr:SDR family NAD(P)-dependent oxidoreductase [Leptospira koniambonensis]TGL28478.1 SDR family NAD(P)-dependent oxidoreductase [Leptospira koniambonensis]
MKTALVTGAGGGIGEAIAIRLDKAGYQLVLCDIKKERMESVSSRLSRKPELIACDLTKQEEVESMVSILNSRFSDLEVLVNNAGYAKEGPFLDQNISEIDRHTGINLLGPIRLIHAVVPMMLRKGSGSVVNIVSIGGIIALADSALYSATKFGLRGFLTAIHEELKGTGVKISGIYPAAVDTPMLLHEALNGGTVLNWLNAVKSPDDVASAVLRGIRTGKLEIYVPYGDGLSSRLAALFPWLVGKLSPVLKWLGEKGRRRWLRKKGIDYRDAV